MQVQITKIGPSIPLKKKGMEVRVHDRTGEHQGDLIISQTGLTWCPGKTTRKRGVRINWNDFIQYAEALP